ncbi:MAG: hypothetical protein IJ106_07400 [Parasporobacterium sp.]|nr:hypothetical protein [Parasporobacterium sp.]
MRKNLIGRHPLTIGALILLGLSVYEFWIRLEDFQAWFLGVRHLSEVRGTPFLEDLAIVFEVPVMRALGYKMLYLFLVVIFAIICLIRRNRRRGMWVILLLTLAAAGCGVLLEFYAFSSWVQAIKLIPLALVAIGSISNLAQRQSNYQRSRRELKE